MPNENRFSLDWTRGELQALAPLVLAAWDDGHLSPGELLAFRQRLERHNAVPESVARRLRAWLDPAAPPTPQALAALRRVARASLFETPETAASSPLAPDGQKEVADALASLNAPLLASLRADSASRRVSHYAIDEARAKALQVKLDGARAPVRDRVRQLLTEPEFRPLERCGREPQRAQVLEWCRTLADRGLGRLAFPSLFDDARDVGDFVAVFETLTYFEGSLSVKAGVQFGLFGKSLETLGSEAHRELLPAVSRCELLGCFAMTERGHGSNVRDLETVARFDVERGAFDLHTPSLSAGKEWIGSAARDAEVAIVFAQLETLGESHGVHPFLVRIRTPDGQLAPGVRLEDCGDKMGLNGVDNGRLWFEHVWLGRDCLLSRFGGVDASGAYSSSIPSSNRRFFTMLNTLVGGRVSVSGGALAAAKVGLSIATRYSAWRTQFPDESGRETPLLDYPAHRRKLLVSMAVTYAYSFAQNQLIETLAGAASEPESMRDVQTLASGVKAFGTWAAISTLQTCRESCGGQGYLSANRIDALRTDTDVFTTFEGDNTVLALLVAKEALSAYRRAMRDKPVRTLTRTVARGAAEAVARRNPLKTSSRDPETLRSLDFHLDALVSRERSLIESLVKRVKRRTDDGVPAQLAFDECADHALAFARARIEREVFEAFRRNASEPLLEKLCALFAMQCIARDFSWFAESRYLGAEDVRALRKGIGALVKELADDALTLVEAFAIPSSCLGPLADPGYLTQSGLAAAPV